MRRRAFLATAGTTLGAGCMTMFRKGNPRRSGPGAHLEGHLDNPDIATNFSFEVGENGTFGDFDFEDADFEFNETAFEVEFEDAFDDGEEKTPIETNKRATELMREGMIGIHETYQAYVGYVGPDATLLDVGSTLDSFNHARIVRLAREARQPLEEASEFATEGQRELILGLVQVTVFLEEMARLRNVLIDAYDRFSWTAERLYAESTTQARRGARILENIIDGAQPTFEAIDEELDREAVQIYQPVGEVYSAKMRRVRNEVRAFGNMSGSIKGIADGIDQFQQAIREYEDKKYETAARSFRSAAFSFNFSQRGLTVFDDGEIELARKLLKLNRARATLAAACKALKESARARVEDERPLFFEKQREAEKIIESNDTVREMSTPYSFVIAG